MSVGGSIRIISTLRLVAVCVLSYCVSACCNDPLLSLSLSLSLSVEDNEQVLVEVRKKLKS